MTQNNSRNIYFDILKGVSIISIVLGHCCNFLVKYVYLYHLAIFFFISGYFYNYNKYAETPFEYIFSKIKSQWKKFVLYSTFIIILHNIFYELQLYPEYVQGLYGKREIFTKIFDSFFLYDVDLFTGALWFVSMYIIANGLFASIMYISSLYNKFSNSIIIVLSILIGCLGLYININEFQLAYHAQTSILLMPFISIGYFFRYYDINFEKIIKFPFFILCIIFMYMFVNVFNLQIELSVNMVGDFFMFYPISITGIYVCLFISKYLNKIPVLKKIFAMIGFYSFEIMALHLMLFKIVDYIICIISNKPINNAFPIGFENAWMLYLIVGVFGSITISKFFKCGFDILKKFNIIRRIPK